MSLEFNLVEKSPEQIVTGNRGGGRRDFPYAICPGICMFHEDLDIPY